MNTVFIALGSNLSDPLGQVQQAIAALKQLPQSHLIAVARFYRSHPLGPQDQPDYLNTVIELTTTLTAESLLDHLQAIERQHGRVRKAQRWGPRTLDLDILLFGQQIIHTERLTIPHYDMYNRQFVLYPLFDLSPHLVFPDGQTLVSRLNQLGPNTMTIW